MPVIFFVFWVLLNGRLNSEVILTGVLVTVLISLLFYRFAGLSPVTERKIILKIFSIIGYILYLVTQMIKANIQIIKIVLSKTIEIRPQIKYFDSPLRSDIAKTALATSIILTPGTIVIELTDERFGVHSIDASMLENIECSLMVKKLRNIEGGH